MKLEIRFLLLICFLALIALFPEPSSIAFDPDHSHQIIGGQLINNGSLPFRNWHASYGPLVFFLSSITGLSVNYPHIIDYFICFSGMFATYILVYLLCRKYVSIKYSFLILITSLTLYPKIYKHYVYWPMLLLIYIQINFKKSFAKDISIGTIISLCFLFRHDFGIFSLSSYVLTALVFRQYKTPSPYIVLSTFLLAVTTFLISTIGIHSLGIYFSDLIFVSLHKSVGLSLPHPLLNFVGWHELILFSYFYSLPILALFIFKKILKEREDLFFLIVASIVCLVQSAHRADSGHLYQSIFPSFVLLAAITSSLKKRSMQFFLILIPLFWGSKHLVRLPVKDWHNMNLKTREEIKSDLMKSNYFDKKLLGDLVPLIETCKSFYAFPFYPNFNFVFNKLPGGELILLAPGYFDSEKYQNSFIENLKRTESPIILWNRDVFFSKESKSNTLVTHHRIWDFLNSNFQKKIHGSYTLFYK